MALKGIEVGAWRLERDKDPLCLELGVQTHTQLLGLLALLAKHCEKDQGVNVYDLPAYGPLVGASSLFSISPKQAVSRLEERDVHSYYFDLRFYQGVRVGGQVLQLETIFHSYDFTLHKPPILSGGRKLRRRGSIANQDPQNLPTYRIQADLLANIEDLSPVTEPGISKKLDDIADYYSKEQLRQRAEREFEHAAAGLALTV